MENTTQLREIVETTVINLRQAAEVNTIIGKPIMTEQGTILPLCEVTFAFIAGGGEYGKNIASNDKFAGATGGGANLTPIGFLVINKDNIKMLNVSGQSNVDKLVDLAKDIFNNANKN